ncbi:PREDICTED: uncharacterized protein LOC109245077 [Nicotiana attenuata]|uniref:uncharacterized protein LOC109245077 n=1 Tax=Nicotiana attenuata TaxID=49451 RepID=UPI0009054AA1|nr:PREDICTED: uncharacterized protein LOC109245077 [Nicotiana attenuata]
MLHSHRPLPSTEANKVHLPTGNVVSMSHTGCTSILSNQDLFSGQVKGIGREEHGLYILHGDQMPTYLSQRVPHSTTISEEDSSMIHSIVDHLPNVPQTAHVPPPQVAEPPTEQRRSSRPIKPPLWLQNYVTTSKGSNCPAYSALSEPTSFKEAASDPQWIAAMKLEIAALKDNHTWSVVDLPPGKTPIGSRWFTESNTKPLWVIFQMDVHNAFLNRDLTEEVYMELPEGFARHGIEFARSKRGILMCQRKHALELISESGLSGAKPAGTPLELNQKLTSVEYDNHFKSDSVQTDENLDNPGVYQRLVGKLLNLTMTRPDIAFVVQVLGQYTHCPKRSHIEAAQRVVRYIKEASGLGLFLLADSSDQLSAFCDSD